MSVRIEDAKARAKIGAGPYGDARMKMALWACIENVKSDTEKYVPMSKGDNSAHKAGNLRRSVSTSRGEEGLISWNAVDNKGRGYAAYVYHMPKSANWTTPGTGPQWVERAATAGGKERWSKMIQAVLNG